WPRIAEHQGGQANSARAPRPVVQPQRAPPLLRCRWQVHRDLGRDAARGVEAMSAVTRLLEAADRGDPNAAAELLPLVYAELRKLASARLAKENPGQTLNATALVHEAYLRLVGEQHFNGRGHFFAAAAEAMRRILVEQARRRQALKRGGDAQREDVDLER